MIDRNAALAIARARIERRDPDDPVEWVIVEENTIERDFGWVFFYQPRRYLETKNWKDQVPGNAPLIVDRRDGSTHFTGTARPLEAYLADYAAKRR